MLRQIGVLVLLLTSPAAAEDFQGVLIAREVDADYNRSRDYGSGWRDADGDCQDARQEVLQEESLAPVILTNNDCAVLQGLWFDPYTEKTFTLPRDGTKIFIDIDHLVPLKEAHQSGAHAWVKSRRVDYANDLDNLGHLIAVDASANRSKGDRDPADWLPPNEDFRCAYLQAWIEVKRKWELTMDQAEADAIEAVLANCGS